MIYCEQVFHTAGEIPYAAIGFAGLPGAITGMHVHATLATRATEALLAGMSAAGITVHEAGFDNKEVTLEGFLWPLRLRSVMAQAQ
jgi:hypothetical protein